MAGTEVSLLWEKRPQAYRVQAPTRPQPMRLVKGNKVFLEWWNHWMSRIHSTPAPETREIPPDPADFHQPSVAQGSARQKHPTASRKTDWTIDSV